MNSNGNRLPIVEALILSSPEPLSSSKIINILHHITAGEIDKIVTELNEKYLMNDVSFRIRKIAGGYQVYITENYAGYVEELFTQRRTQKLTRAALETLAIIAYRQPVTRVDIEMIRGVSSDSAIRTLLERKFIRLSGRAKTIGRPLLYSTTDEFLKYFSLNSLNDLPKMEEIEELLSAKEQESQQILAFESAKSEQNDNILEEQDEIVEPSETSDTDDISDADDISDTGDTNDAGDTGDVSESDDITQNESLPEKINESTGDNSIAEYPVNRIKALEIVEEEIEDEKDVEKEPVNIISAIEEF